MLTVRGLPILPPHDNQSQLPVPLKLAPPVLIFNATHRKAEALVVAALVHATAVRVHDPEVRVAAPVLRGAPPVAVEAGAVEAATGEEAAAARQSRKAKVVCTVTATIPPGF